MAFEWVCRTYNAMAQRVRFQFQPYSSVPFRNISVLICYCIGVILRYSRSTENGAYSSHIHGGVRLLNS